MKLSGVNTSFATAYSYTAADDVSSITYPSGRTVNYTRDTNGRVVRIVSSGAVIVSAVTYLPYGDVTSIPFGNGVVQNTGYDLDYRPVSIVSGKGGLSVQNVSLTWNGVENITALNDNLSSVRNQTFVYDALDRLTRATQSGSGGYGVLDYAYDANGNRVSRVQTVSGSVVDNEAYSYLAGSNRW